MTFPKPPTIKATPTNMVSSDVPIEAPTPQSTSNRNLPLPPKTPVSNIELIQNDDIAFIFKAHLRIEHRQNPFVMTFLSSYVMCRDVNQAAREANITPREGKMILNRKDVQETLAKITESAVMKYGIDPEEVVEKVKSVAYVDPAELVNPVTGAAYENMHDIPIEARRAIKKFVVENLWREDRNGIRSIVGKVVKVEMWDRLKASEMLGREVNLFKETVVQQHDVTGNMKDLLLESKRRAEERILMDQGEAVPKLVERKR